MEREQAEAQLNSHLILKDKFLMHKSYQEKMQLIEMGVTRTQKSNACYIYCKLKGRYGQVIKSLDYILEYYTVC